MVKVCVIHRADPTPPTSVIERGGIQLVLNSYFTYAGQRTRIHHQASPITNALSHNDLFLRYSRDAVVVVGVTSPPFLKLDVRPTPRYRNYAWKKIKVFLSG